MVVALGLDDALVGISHSCDYPPRLPCPTVTSTTIPTDASSREIDRAVKESRLGGRPLYELDVALIESLRPDLIITQAVCDVCAVGEAQALCDLRPLSVRPHVVSLHPHRLEDVFADMITLGEAAGVTEKAREVVAELRGRVDSSRARIVGRDPVGMVVLEWLDPPFSAGHWTPDLVAAAGGRELLAHPGDHSRELTWEEIGAADPDVLLLACCGHDERRTLEDVRALEAEPGFLTLRAAQLGRVHVADGGAHFSRPGPRLVDSLELLAETLHPGSQHEVEGLRKIRIPDRSS